MNTPVSNAPKNNFGSFVMAPVSAVGNVAKNAVNSITNTTTEAVNSIKNTTTNMAKNMWNSDAVQSLTEPIQDSYNAVLENNADAIFSIPVILLLGFLVIFFILFLIFRDQIVFGLEVAWIKVKGWFSPTPPPATQAPPPEFSSDGPTVEKSAVEKILPGRKQVFNVATNKYRYSDAEPLCKAFGAELATYDQVKEAWSKGADWCNYGWVKGQAAVYPTQQATYDKLQAGPEDQRGACGIPGVNGGYFDNPDIRFGVNCYGNRPSENETDVRKKMGADGVMTQDGLVYNRKVQDYKAHLSEIPVNPFSEQVWSE
jgi:Extracellular link domain